MLIPSPNPLPTTSPPSDIYSPPIYSSKLTDLNVSGDLTEGEEPCTSGLEIKSGGVEVFESSGEDVGIEGEFDGAEVDGEEDSALGWDLGGRSRRAGWEGGGGKREGRRVSFSRQGGKGRDGRK